MGLHIKLSLLNVLLQLSIVWSCALALANCNIDCPTESKVFSRADVSNVTWGVYTIMGLTGPGGP